MNHNTYTIDSDILNKEILNAQILCILSNKLERLMVSIFASGAEPYETELGKIKKELYTNILPDVIYDYTGPYNFKETLRFTFPDVYPYYDFNDFKTTFKELLKANGLDIKNEESILFHFKTNIIYFINALGVDKIIKDLGITGEVLKHIKSGKKDDDDDNFLNFNDHMNKLFYLFRYYIGKEDFKWSTIFFIIDVMNKNILKRLQEIYEKLFVSDYNTNNINLEKLNERIARKQGDEQSGGAKKKKDSKVVAKRVPTPYNNFVKKHFPELKKKFPNDKAPQIMQKIAIEWKKTKK